MFLVFSSLFSITFFKYLINGDKVRILRCNIENIHFVHGKSLKLFGYNRYYFYNAHFGLDILQVK